MPVTILTLGLARGGNLPPVSLIVSANDGGSNCEKMGCAVREKPGGTMPAWHLSKLLESAFSIRTQVAFLLRKR